MSFIAPLAFALAGLAIPIILLYMLRMRRQEQLISSTILWRELARDRTANAPWQKLRRNIFLFLQLLILTALVLSLARPFVLSAEPVDGQVFVLLDASASMAAADASGGRTRFDEAVATVHRFIDDIDGNDRMTLVVVSDSPVVAAAGTNDRALLESALATVTPRLTSADWHAAFTLVNGSLQGTGDPRIIIISDGRLPDDLPSLAGESVFFPVGSSSDNVAISVLGSRRHEDQLELLVGAANYGLSDSNALMSIYTDGQLYDSRRIDLAAGDEESFNWALPTNVSIVEARISPEANGTDYLAADNQAWAIPGNNSETSIKLVTNGNQFVERFFTVFPGHEVTRINPANTDSSGEEWPYDIHIYDGVSIPSTLPEGNILIIDPQPVPTQGSNPQISVTEVFTNTRLTRMANDPLLADVAWDEVNIAQARQVQGAGLSPLIESEGGPLLLTGEIDGRRIAIFPFDLASSDLPLRIAFPVIMANITEWLRTGSLANSNGNIEPGAVVTLPSHPRAESVRVGMPNGESWTPSEVGDGGVVFFDHTTNPGLYNVDLYDEGGELIESSQFAVNFFNPQESQITPSETIQVGEKEVLSDNEETRGRRELWAIVLGVGLLLLAFEWWLSYHRGLNRRLLKAK